MKETPPTTTTTTTTAQITITITTATIITISSKMEGRKSSRLMETVDMQWTSSPLQNGKRTVSPLAARKALLSTLIICRSTTPHLACSPVIRAGVSATPEWTRILMRERFYFYYLSTLLARPISGSNYVPSKYVGAGGLDHDQHHIIS
ncbi:hypothetical protein Tco_0131520 [Tanacetum coccineum]